MKINMKVRVDGKEASADHLAETLTEQNLLDLEYEAFMELLKTKPTLNRIEHMLETGKPLRN